MSIANLTTTLDWKVTEQSLTDTVGDIDGYKTLRRSDNNFVLNVCRKSYTVYPNEELVRLATEIEEVSEGAYKLEGFGEWQGGGIVMAQLKQQHSIGLCGWEDENYMLLGNGHNGQRAFFIGHINKLVRCSNQFGSISTKLRVPHTSGILEHSKNFGKIVKLYTERQKHMREILERGYDVKIDRKLITACIDQVLEVEKNGGRSELGAKRKAALMRMESSMDRELAEVGANLFGLFNGVTHYSTHSYQGKMRQYSAILGTEKDINQRGFSFIEKQLKNAERTLVTV